LRGTVVKQSWWLHLMLWFIPVPWIASEFGWITTEVGRQPWIVNGMLPTFLGSSSIDTPSIAFTLGGFMVLYFVLFCIEIFLMFKYARLGPSSLGEKRYYFEKLDKKLAHHHLKKKGA
jgi:cytochrome d ubiquinol oxidase subunit I